MLEFPEVIAIAHQLEHELAGKRISAVLPPGKPHKFCWFNGDPADYESQIKGSQVASVIGFGLFVEINFTNGMHLCFNDGVNARLLSDTPPKNYQLLIQFDDGIALCFTVSMYGGLILHDGSYDNEYYLKSRRTVSPFSMAFMPYYLITLLDSKPTLSAKAFLATEQRFPGIGNGVLQDILFEARMHPKRKLNTLNETEKANLAECIITVLKKMTAAGGRDTEKDIYGKPCGYKTIMSKNSLSAGCPVCGGPITKETYLGGSVYYCPDCQPLIKEFRPYFV